MQSAQWCPGTFHGNCLSSDRRAFIDILGGEAFLAGGFVVDVVDDVALVAGHTEEVRELVDHQPDCRVLADGFGVHLLMLVPRRQASAIDSATPLGLQAPGLTIPSASRKRLPWGVFVQI